MTRHTHLTVKQAIAILNRTERGREVGRELYRLLGGPAASLDIGGKMAVLALLEESFINRPGTVYDALAKFEEA